MVNEFNNQAFLGPHSIKVGPFTSNSSIIKKTFTSQTLDHSNKLRFKTDWEVSL